MNVFNPYAKEIHSHLKAREKAVYRSFNLRYLAASPKIYQREAMIDLIKYIGEAFKLSVTTVHLSISIFDRYVKKDDGLKVYHLELLSVCAIVLAAKFEEESVDIPMYSTLIRFLSLTYTKEQLISLEPCILKALKYDLSRPTVANFAEYYETFAVLETDWSTSFESNTQLKESVDLSLREYLDLSLHLFKLLQYQPSQVAAACLLAARNENKVRPIWPHTLTSLTGYTLDSVRNIMLALISRMEKKSLQKTPVYLNESGYESSSQSTTPVSKKIRSS